ncbi:hypothetical protein WAF17_22560 (plasmid) [Bernardetia sp. ABR2-2B]|uniref:hypothetical protein n=1 Tax=Bernardetia sp. ABR2-2B TaxID=3127472 RepID=UPI0030CEAAA1
MKNNKRINYSRKLSDNVRIDLFKIIYEQFFEGSYDKDNLDQQQDAFKKIGTLLKEVSENFNNQIETKQDLIRVFFAHYYILFPNMPSNVGVLNEIDLMLQLQQEIILLEAQKDDLNEENRVLKEKVRQLEEEKAEHKSLFSYHSQNRN